ncbi:Crp/Fnr family transcriptional regulator [Flavobacterium amniphilum]|uniref:Crp/Fnr family transcriptional regulator n=1 Tax=Flavobacterium amniphilum TaxID=1834035 RepID=UPI00202A659C|nr:Crp/Fnr family transcriptional regulator [Flavobacterium amniphilum]MCL9806985.1 Crp/Fnr family transcriptional regulator [Flavobacterium amniphilum]
MQVLLNHINKYITTPVSENEFKLISSYFIYKKIRKKQYLLVEGTVCKYFAFIKKGAMRKYYIDENGKENIVNLYLENWWVVDRQSYSTKTPSSYFIDAWEDCELLMITIENKQKLENDSPSFKELIYKMRENNDLCNLKRITSLTNCCAETRYNDLISNYPEFLQRFPQNLIASYLGITKETLSRIRKLNH